MLGIYCRTSKARKEKYTIENQKDNGIKSAQKLGVPYRIYVDVGISATQTITYAVVYQIFLGIFQTIDDG